MKAIIQAYSPEELERIVRGEQTIKVCKTAPKDTPFKVYMYCTTEKIRRGYLHTTNHKDRLYVWSNPDDTEIRVEPDGYTYTAYSCHRKVIGEYVCEKIDEYEANDRGWYIYPQDEVCMWADEIAGYGKGKPLFGLHISSLNIYDKPKSLNSFKIACNKSIQCNACEYRALVWHEDKKDFYYECGRPAITHAPRGWQYVEEL